MKCHYRWVFNVDGTIQSQTGGVMDILGKNIDRGNKYLNDMLGGVKKDIGAAIIVLPRLGGDHQRFKLVPTGRKLPFVPVRYMCSKPFLIKNRLNGFALTGSSTSGAKVVV